MNAIPILAMVLESLAAERLEAVLIGNAAAAIHGAPVTTLDFDFMFRETATTLRKLKAVARRLDAVIMRPYYPVSKLYRVTNDAAGIQLNFMPVIHGVRSFESLRSRASEVEVAGRRLLVASLDDILKSKQAAGRDRDLAVLDVLKQTPGQQQTAAGKSDDKAKPPKKTPARSAGKSERARGSRAGADRAAALAVLAAETDRQLIDLIRRRLALPVEQRMNFLRRRLPGGGSCL